MKIKTDSTFKNLTAKREEFLKQAGKVFDSLLYEVTQNEKTSKTAQNGNYFVPSQFIFNIGCKFVTGQIAGDFILGSSETEMIIVNKDHYLDESTAYKI